MKRLIVDLDHTICIPADGSDQTSDPTYKYRHASPVPDVIARLRAYHEAGFEIVIHTSRNMRTYNGDVAQITIHTLPAILAWLEENLVPFTEVIVGKPWCGFDGFYIDDRAIRPSEFASMSKPEIDALLAKERA